MIKTNYLSRKFQWQTWIYSQFRRTASMLKKNLAIVYISLCLTFLLVWKPEIATSVPDNLAKLKSLLSSILRVQKASQIPIKKQIKEEIASILQKKWSSLIDINMLTCPASQLEYIPVEMWTYNLHSFP